eukprot:gene22416-34329_t
MLAAVVAAACALSATDRPIIGIWAQPYENCDGCEYVAASYVKWVESAGGRAVPIRYNGTEEQTREIFGKINGVLYTGGASNITKGAKDMYKLAIAANKQTPQDYFPVWGTCLGFEWIMQMQSENDEILYRSYDAENITLALNLTGKAAGSRLFNLPGNPSYGEHLRGILANASNPPAMNNHGAGVAPDTFAKTELLTSFFDVLSTNNDREGQPFVSTVEAADDRMPVFAVQWHPEKNMFEWAVNPQDPELPKEVINHTPDAVKASQALADVFVSHTRMSNHRYPNATAAFDALFWNYPIKNSKTGDFSQRLPR